SPGNAVVVWQRYDGTNSRVQARARSAGGALSAIQTLSAAGQNALDAQVGVDSSSGDAVVVWERSDGTNLRVQARARTAGGAVSGVQTPSAAGQVAFVPEVGVDSAGNAVVVWERFDGANLRVQARARAAGGAVGTTQTLSIAGEDAETPQVALNSG